MGSGPDAPEDVRMTDTQAPPPADPQGGPTAPGAPTAPGDPIDGPACGPVDGRACGPVDGPVDGRAASDGAGVSAHGSTDASGSHGGAAEGVQDRPAPTPAPAPADGGGTDGGGDDDAADTRGSHHGSANPAGGHHGTTDHGSGHHGSTDHGSSGHSGGHHGGHGGGLGHGAHRETPDAPPPPPPAPPRPPLERSSDRRVVAGVCEGVGRYLDIDPLVFRVVVAVLCLWGGVGLFLYGMAWLVMPVQRTGRSELQRLLSGKVDGQSLGAVLVTVLGTGIFFSYMGAKDHLFPLLLIGLLAFAALRYDPARHQRPPRPPEPPDAGPEPAPAAPPWWQRRTPSPPPAEPTAEPSDAVPAQAPAVTLTKPAPAPATPPEPRPGPRPEPTPFTPPPADAPSAPPPPASDHEPAPQAQPPRRRPGAWFALLFTLLAVAAATTVGVVGAHRGHVNALAVAATALLVLAVGVALSALLGGSRGLVALAALVSAATVAIGATPWAWRSDAHATVWRPASASALHADYHLGGGRAVLDLRQLRPGPGVTLVTHVQVGVGTLRVLLPTAPEAHIDAQAGLGQVRLPTGATGGLGPSRSATINGAGAAADGTVQLDLQIGAGRVEVVR